MKLLKANINGSPQSKTSKVACYLGTYYVIERKTDGSMRYSSEALTILKEQRKQDTWVDLIGCLSLNLEVS